MSPFGGLNRLPGWLKTGQGEVEMQTMEQMRLMTANDLAMFGVQDIAYVKPVVVDGNAGYAIHAADGTPIMLTDSREAAIANAVSQQLETVSVH